MPRGRTPTVNLEEAKARFEERRQSRRGNGRIPAELWSAAVAVARKEGLNRTAQELHVSWHDLKRRMAIAAEVPLQPVSPAFVELVAPRAASLPECTIELEEGRRGKLRIQLKNVPASYLATLSWGLWEQAS